jgi:hypothetical protein
VNLYVFVVDQVGAPLSDSVSRRSLKENFLQIAGDLGPTAALIQGSDHEQMTNDLLAVMSESEVVGELVRVGAERHPGLLILGAHPRELGDEDLVLLAPFSRLVSSPDSFERFFSSLADFAHGRGVAFLESFTEFTGRAEAALQSIGESDFIGVGKNLRVPQQPDQTQPVVHAVETRASPDSAHGADTEVGLQAIEGMGPILGERYRKVSLLGRGGMGEVYVAADDRGPGRKVAIKVIRPDRWTDASYALFQRELNTLFRLDQIASVVRVFDSSLERSDQSFIVTEYIDGWNLHDFLYTQCPARRERLELFSRICDTFDSVHEEGIVHGDIKPQNILIRRKRLGGRIQFAVCDFGLSRAVIDHTDLAGVPMGTLSFMSPEHVGDGPPMTRRSDVYSLGVLLYWLLVESLPYSATLKQIRHARMGLWPFVPALIPELHVDERGVEHGVSKELAAIVYRAMNPTPSERYQSAYDLGDAVEEWLGDF